MITRKLQELKIGFEAGLAEFRNDLPTLVMIHGAGGSSNVWKAQTHLLKRQCNTFALDLPGHGKTEGNGSSDINEYATWLNDVLAAVFPDTPFLMGHSMGGAIVQTAVLLRPELFKGIILVGTGPRLQVAPTFLDGLRNDFEKVVETLLGLCIRRPYGENHRHRGNKANEADGAESRIGRFQRVQPF